MRFPILLLFVALLQSPAGPAPNRPFALTANALAKVTVPAPARDAVLDDLEYDSPNDVRGVILNLNYDGRRDCLVRSAQSLCGNGGCPYAIVDGAAGKVLGQVFGEPLYVLAEDAHGWAVIAGYSHLSADSASYTIWQFDGTTYQKTSSRVVQGAALQNLTDSLKRIPTWRAGPSKVAPSVSSHRE